MGPPSLAPHSEINSSRNNQEIMIDNLCFTLRAQTWLRLTCTGLKAGIACVRTHVWVTTAYCHHPTALCGQTGCLEQRFPVSGHMYGSPQPGPAYCHHPTALCGQSGCLEQRFPRVRTHVWVPTARPCLLPPPHSPVWPEWVLRTEISCVRTHVWVPTARPCLLPPPHSPVWPEWVLRTEISPCQDTCMGPHSQALPTATTPQPCVARMGA